MDIVIGSLMYFGALLVPAIYLVATRRRGVARRPMIIGVVFEVIAAIGVWALVAYSHRAGYRDYFMGWAFMLPINALCFLYFVGVVFFYARHE
jgi:ABC-type Mn2+/Zn2+ transport system permease subunit